MKGNKAKGKSGEARGISQTNAGDEKRMRTTERQAARVREFGPTLFPVCGKVDVLDEFLQV